jgi:hypothetical protein
VYEAAENPAICERIYLQGLLPNCRAYYAHYTPPPASPTRTSEILDVTMTMPPTSTVLPIAKPTNLPTPAPSPTPQYVLDLSGYDSDIFPPIDVSHNPPLIARSDEMVVLVFDFANIFCMNFPVSCIPEGVLHYSYGETNGETIPLEYEIVDEMESLVARVPATDQDGNALRYYAEFSVPEAGYTQRYPGAGTIDLFTTEKFIPVELPVENMVKPGEVVYDFFWGYGPDKVRQATYDGYPRVVGPPALDVADDGRIALIDPVNERILIFDPNEGSYSSYPMPFAYGFLADLAFDQEGRLMVCDFQGEEVEGTFGPDPFCYLLHANGSLVASAPVYVRSPSKLTKNLKILDYSDSKLVAPFNSQGGANSREIQRQKENWEFPLRYVESQDPFVARFADVKKGVVFEVDSDSPLGVLTEFAETPQGYIMTFNIGDQIRAVWFDPSGIVLKEVTLPNSQFSEVNFNGQVAIDQNGSLYFLESTKNGMFVHFVDAPIDY